MKTQMLVEDHVVHKVCQALYNQCLSRHANEEAMKGTLYSLLNLAFSVLSILASPISSLADKSKLTVFGCK